MTVARLAAAVIATIAWTGLAIQFRASFASLGDMTATAWVMLRYFTVIVNLLVAVFFTALAAGRTAPRLLAGVTMAILLVGVVYHLLLSGLIALSGGAKLADLINHTVTPVLVGLYWLMLAPKGHLRRRDPLLWGLLPLSYFLYTLVRGAYEGIYAYPFLDVVRLGWRQTLLTAIVMAAGFVISGMAMLWVDGRIGRKEKASRN